MKYIICYIVLLAPSTAYSLDIELKGSIAGKSGNTNTSSQLWDSSLSQRTTNNLIAINLKYNRDKKDHITYSEGYKLKIVDEYNFTNRYGGYLKYEFYRDTFRGYDKQNKYSIGHLIFWNKWFKTRIGYKYYDDSSYYVLGYIFEYEIFKSKLGYIEKINESSDYEINFTSGLKFKLYKYFSLEFNYTHLYKNDPILEKLSKTDSKYYTMLVINI